MDNIFSKIFVGGVITELLYGGIKFIEYICKEFRFNPNYVICIIGGIIFTLIFNYFENKH